MSTRRPLRIAFVHPDLGIGGAERLVIDAAVGLQQLGHQVELFTSFHDKRRCFRETVDGTLKVHVLGNSIVPRSIAGRFTLVCAILRQLTLICSLVFSLVLHIVSPVRHASTDTRDPHHWPLTTTTAPLDVYIVDQLSVGIPLIRWLTNTRVVFYCHFPDLLMNPDRTGASSFWRSLYRWPLDWLEERTTGQADKILVNSEFTADIFERTFAQLQRAPRVVYPGIHTSGFDSKSEGMRIGRPALLSINRFERKKNLDLAIRALALLRNASSPQLILAGGYDDRLQDNVHTLASLRSLCDSLGLQHDTLDPSTLSHTLSSSATVLFLPNLPDLVKVSLLTSPDVRALLYTPTNEHLGIVPLEAMAAGLPVLACNSGGPLETIEDPATGRLRPPDPPVWAETLTEILSWTEVRRQEVGRAGQERVREKFEVTTMAREMERACEDARAMDAMRPVWREDSSLLAAAMLVGALVAIVVGSVVY